MLQSLKLVNFRNYERAEFEFGPGLTVLTGANGQGKTNVLEAVYYLSLLRSFRTRRLEFLKRWQSPGFFIGAECCSAAGRVSLSVAVGDERRMLVNGQPIRSTSEFISRLVCGTFIPEDMELVKGDPSIRRRFLDIALCQLSHDYLVTLQKYQLALEHRNAMLKNMEKYNRQTLTAYDHMLVQTGSRLELARKDLIRSLERELQPLSRRFFSDKGEIALKYLSGIQPLLREDPEEQEEAVQNAFHAALQKSFERDCREGNTRYGPHRSDVSCLLAGVALQGYGSVGECRMAALAIRFACLQVLRQRLGDDEVTLIVDDVTGELDGERRTGFFSLLQESGQVLFACTAVPPELQPVERVYAIQAGRPQLIAARSGEAQAENSHESE